MKNTPSTDKRPSERGWYICKVRRFASGGVGWVAADAVLYWDGSHWWMDQLHTEDFDGIYSFRGPLYLSGHRVGMASDYKRVNYSQ